MLQNSCSQKNQGFIISMYYLQTSLSGVIATAGLGYYQTQMDAT